MTFNDGNRILSVDLGPDGEGEMRKAPPGAMVKAGPPRRVGFPSERAVASQQPSPHAVPFASLLRRADD